MLSGSNSFCKLLSSFFNSISSNFLKERKRMSKIAFAWISLILKNNIVTTLGNNEYGARTDTVTDIISVQTNYDKESYDDSILYGYFAGVKSDFTTIFWTNKDASTLVTNFNVKTIGKNIF
mgnify:CR=1 FL=1